MLTNIVIYILSCFVISLFISIFLPFDFEGEHSYLEEYIYSLSIGFVFSAFIAPLILFLLGVLIAIILFSTVGCIYLLFYCWLYLSIK